MSSPRPFSQASATSPGLPLDDAFLRSPELDVDALAQHWASFAVRRPMTAEQMRGADARAQRLGVAGAELMEQAGYAIAAAARAALRTYERSPSALVLVLAGPGNNGGDGFVAARHLAEAGIRCVVALVSGPGTPGTADARLNWERLEGLAEVDRMHSASHHDVAILISGIERAALIIDALLGSGVRGPLREPVRSAVDLCLRARRSGVPVLSVDTPTAVDLTSGLPSNPVVAASLTVTFHRPKEGLLTRRGSRLAGRVLVAPIGIPSAADPA
ncbi:MAG TPA: NAD(P)H-hydrate epimerase [Candidatus Limnocylindrales bacterium]|nr:NAD(P)H-hydrate epimerase [Candidatus Limnocylindrales bacterium]